MTLGQKIKDARLARGMTQKELVGDFITRNMLSKIENDSATPSVRTLERLAGALGLPTGYFLDQAGYPTARLPTGLTRPAPPIGRETGVNACACWKPTARRAPPTRDICSTPWPARGPPDRRWTPATPPPRGSWPRQPSIIIRKGCITPLIWRPSLRLRWAPLFCVWPRRVGRAARGFFGGV